MIKEQTNQTFKGRQTKNKLKKIKILSKKKKKITGSETVEFQS
jgi:hypothetical protein